MCKDLIINEQQLFEYMKCPIRYDFIKKGIAPTDDATYKKQLYLILKNLYLSTLDTTYKNISPLKNKWDKYCSTHLLDAKKALEGWGCILNAYNYITANNITFTDVDCMYELEIPGAQLIIKGQLDPFIEHDTYIEVFISHTTKKMPDKSDIDKKLKHTIDAYILSKKFKKDVVFNYYNCNTNQSMITTRSTLDFNRLENIITQIGKALTNNIIFPRESFMCSSCCYLELCSKWGVQ